MANGKRNGAVMDKKPIDPVPQAPLAETGKENAALAEQQQASIASLLSFLRPLEGFEDEPGKSDLIFPIAKLIQATSDELKDRDLIKQFPHISFGAIINSITKELMPEEFIPAFRYKSWIRFNPRKKEDRGYDSNFAMGAMMWRTNDPHDPRVIAEGAFGPNGEPPLATEYMNFFCYFPGVSTPIIVGFAKTSYGAGKTLFSLHKTCPTNVYRLTSASEDKGKGIFAKFKVNVARKATPEELDLCAKLREAFFAKKENIQAHDQDKANAEEEAAAAPAPEKRPY